MLVIISSLHKSIATANGEASIIISEVGWAGTASSSSDEWVELFNSSCEAVNIDGWTLAATDGVPSIALTGTMPPGFWLFERTDDNVVSNISADFIYTGSLANGGEILWLTDSSGMAIASANSGGGSWPAGESTPRRSMQLISPDAADVDASWASNSGIDRNGLDADGNPINGTPRMANEGWTIAECVSAELSVVKTGPATADQASTFNYTIAIANSGNLTASNVTITDTLPAGLSYSSDTSSVDPVQVANKLVWSLGEIAPNTPISFSLAVQADAGLNAILINRVTVSTTSRELNAADNQSTYQTRIGKPVLLNAVHYSAYTDGDEAVQLINLSTDNVDLSGWRISDSLSSGVTFADMANLEATSWIAKDAVDFERHFGFSTDYATSDLSGSWPQLSNNGDTVFLFDDNDQIVDTLVYGDGDITVEGWNGSALQPYRPTNTFSGQGQILYRKIDQLTGLPTPDTNSQSDWAQDPFDPIDGSKVRYPGWDLEQFFFPQTFTESASLTIAITPDNAFNTLKALIDDAQSSIKISIFTFTNHALMDVLADAAARGVSVDLLQEGAPPAGLLDQQRALCQQLEANGGRCWFMINENSGLPTNQRVWDRYKFFHAKYMLVDGAQVMVSSDNFSPNSMPNDTDSGTTSGRRGVVLITDSAEVINHVQSIWHADFAPAVDYDADCRGASSGSYHCDVFRWQPNDSVFGDRYGAPEPTFQLDTSMGGVTYTIRYAEATTVVDTFDFEIVQAPENSLRTNGGLLGLVTQATAGDTVYVQQLDERAHWGAANASAELAPNPRLEAYIDAARRGADVWIMLDQFFGEQYYDPADPPTNQQTCSYVQQVADAEGFRIRCTLANPTDRGIHNKMVLVELDGKGYIHVGSINGSEQSSKGNRELALQVQSDDAYALLADMFERDWPHRVFTPLVLKDVKGPVQYPLITEIYFNPSGIEDASEFIEIANPTNTAIDISGWSIGDAVSTEDFEDVRIFPGGTVIQPRQAVVVTFNGLAFEAEFQHKADFEILDSDPSVPNMIDDALYDIDAQLRLGNSGDEVLLRNQNKVAIDVVTYGSGSFKGVISFPLPGDFSGSLERVPFTNDTDNGVNDFRGNVPSPGQLPN